METQVAAVLTEHLLPWTFDGSEPFCVDLAALLETEVVAGDVRAALDDWLRQDEVTPELIDALLAMADR